MARLDGPFGDVDAVVQRLHKFPMAILIFEEGLDGCRCLVVCDIKRGRVPFLSQLIKDFYERFDDCLISEICDWDCKMALVS